MPRTQLLISVRSAAEAIDALDAGADIIDIKEPLRGSLGSAEPRTMHAVLTAVAGRRPVSAALGELIEQPPLAALPRDLRYVKVGLHGAALRPWARQLAQLFASIPHIAPIAVAYADTDQRNDPPTPTPNDVLQWAIDHRAAGILLDTHRKTDGDLLAHHSAGWLQSFIDRAHAARLLVALAGSLRLDSIPAALALKPDIIAVRSAACHDGERQKPIDPARVRQLSTLIAAQTAHPHRPAPLQATRAAN